MQMHPYIIEKLATEHRKDMLGAAQRAGPRAAPSIHRARRRNVAFGRRDLAATFRHFVRLLARRPTGCEPTMIGTDTMSDRASGWRHDSYGDVAVSHGGRAARVQS
jgi:hypothetical protein